MNKPPKKASAQGEPKPQAQFAQGPQWHNLFVKTQRGEIASNVANVILALSHDPEWKGVLGFNTFIGDIEAVKPPPWRGDLAPGQDSSQQQPGPRYWTNQDTTRCTAWLARKHGLLCQEGIVGSALYVVAEQHKFHPVRDYLENLEWDGEERVNSWLIRHAGANDDHYTRAVTAKWMIGLVARVMDPGCMFRMMLILEGPQDIRKSTALRTIAMRDEWFMETTIDMGSKDSYQVLRGKWIVEFAELDSLSRSETSRVKQYVSERTSTYRPSYARGPADFRRQCGFAGSTNDAEYLKDDTGATRFFPVAISRSIDIEALVKEREQLWAEAVARYKKGELPFINNKRILSLAAQVTEARRQADPWEDPVSRWLQRLPPKRIEQGVTTYEALTQAVMKEASTLSRGDEIRMGKVLRTCGWALGERPRAGVDGVRKRVYRKAPGPLTAVSGDGQPIGPLGHDRTTAVRENRPKNPLVQLVQSVQTVSNKRER